MKDKASNQLNHAIALNNLKRYEESLAAFQSTIDIDPKNTDAWSNMGVVLADKFDRPDEALAAYQNAIDIDPKHVGAWNNMGILLAGKLDRPDEALAAYQSATNIDPKNTEVWSNMGVVLADKLNRPDEALAAYQSATNIDPKNTDAWSNMGALLVDEFDRPDEALAAYQNAIDIDPKHAGAWNNMGILLADKLDCPDEALAAYQNAIDIDPKNSEAWSNMGALLVDKLNRPDEALAAYQSAIDIDPKNTDAWSNMGTFLARKFDRPDEALVAYQNAIDIDPKNADAWHNMGALLADKLDRPDEALAAYQSATNIDPKHTSAWHNIGVERIKLNQFQEAVKAFLKSSLWGGETNENQHTLGLGQLSHALEPYKFSTTSEEAISHLKKVAQACIHNALLGNDAIAVIWHHCFTYINPVYLPAYNKFAQTLKQVAQDTKKPVYQSLALMQLHQARELEGTTMHFQSELAFLEAEALFAYSQSLVRGVLNSMASQGVEAKSLPYVGPTDWLPAVEMFEADFDHYRTNIKSDRDELRVCEILIDDVLSTPAISSSLQRRAIGLYMTVLKKLIDHSTDKSEAKISAHIETLIKQGHGILLQAYLSEMLVSARMAFDTPHYKKARAIAKFARLIGDSVRHMMCTRPDKERWLLPLSGLGPVLANATLKLRQDETGAIEAMAALENALAILMHEELDLRTADLNKIRKLSPEASKLADAFSDKTARWTEIAKFYANDLQSNEGERKIDLEEIKNLQESIASLITDIRRIQPDFLTPVTSSDIFDAAKAVNASLIYVSPGPKESVALIATPKGQARYLFIPEFKESNINRICQDYIEHYDNFLKAYKNPELSEREDIAIAYIDKLDEVCRTLGPMMERIRAALPKGTEHAVLIPTGHFSFLPLHAAWMEAPWWHQMLQWCKAPISYTFGKKSRNRSYKRLYALDDICFTYAPTARSLLLAARNAPNCDARPVLTVHSPFNSGQEPLPGVGELCRSIHKKYNNEGDELFGNKATLNVVKSAIHDAGTFHFSWHGKADLKKPMDETGLILVNGELLSLRSLLGENFMNLRLSVLSACDTGLRGHDMPDEALAMPAGFMAAGSCGVIAAMWAVPVRETNVIMKEFYRLWRQEGINDPAVAFQQAQKAFRDGQITLEQPQDGEPLTLGMFRETALKGKIDKKIQSHSPRIEALKNLPRDHPFFWAAFQFTGV